jgi:predicted transcriptional regulator
MTKIEIDIGQSLDEVGAGFVAAWKAAEAGPVAEAESRLHFLDWAALCAVLTPKRYALLRHLRQTPASGVRALARSLGRDVRRVHADVVALAELGLLARAADGGLSTPVDEIGSTIRFAA